MVQDMPDPKETLEWISWIELSYLALAGALPERFERAGIALEESVPIYDLNGTELMRRVPLESSKADEGGHVDIAVHPALGEPVVSWSTDNAWNADRLREEGLKAAKRREIPEIDACEIRFVAYSFPKIALQFLSDGEEVAMLELETWEPVPPSSRRPNYEPPADFERWSYLDELPDDHRHERQENYAERIRRWREFLPPERAELNRIDREAFARQIDFDLELERIPLHRSRELHYSTRDTDHEVCYEVRGQETSVWCVAASVQMLLDFYRYEYTQVRLAQELGLGTLSSPNGLPYSRDSDVVTVLEGLTCSALDADMNTSPTFAEYVAEIDANRPLISFIPGHSRTVAGYFRSFMSLPGQSAFRGLLVYDPWPPDTGVITRWENYDVTTYRRTFTAKVCSS